MRQLPKRWLQYESVGNRVQKTRFLPFKVPLRQELCRSLDESERFTPTMLLDKVPSLKAIIDLTDTNRYYDREEFIERGLFYKKINIPGQGKIPPIRVIHSFYRVVDELTKSFGQDPDALIGVHCTHGLNRTGYLICKYMVDRMNVHPYDAIRDFEAARGYKIEREVFTQDIQRQVAKPTSDFVPVSHSKTSSSSSSRYSEREYPRGREYQGKSVGRDHNRDQPRVREYRASFSNNQGRRSNSSETRYVSRRWREERIPERGNKSASGTNWRQEPRGIPGQKKS